MPPSTFFPHLSNTLYQTLDWNASMEMKQVASNDQVRDFVIAGHGNLMKVKQMLAQDPSLLNAVHHWSETDTETAIQAAAQVGNNEIAEFLLEKGAPLEICTAAMLGNYNEVKMRIDRDPQQARAMGAHSIPLLPRCSLERKRRAGPVRLPARSVNWRKSCSAQWC